jgi:cell division protein FtsN
MWGSWYKNGAVPDPVTRQPEVAADRMRHLSEPGARPVRRSDNTAPTGSLTAVQHVCYAVGPFASTRSAAAGGAQLKKLGLAYRLRTSESTSNIYRVYLPPSASHEEAQAMQRRLRKLGYKDNALLREGAMKNAISLGVYSVKANADRTEKQLKKQGIRARIQKIERVVSRNWLDIDSAEVAVETLQAIRWEKGVSVEQVPCSQSGGS